MPFVISNHSHKADNLKLGCSLSLPLNKCPNCEKLLQEYKELKEKFDFIRTGMLELENEMTDNNQRVHFSDHIQEFPSEQHIKKEMESRPNSPCPPTPKSAYNSDYDDV
jgi:hypothetical protein